VKDGQARGSAAYTVDRRSTPTKKKLTGFDPLHFENRKFLPFVICHYFFQTLFFLSPLGLGYNPEDDNWTGQLYDYGLA